MTGTVDRVDRVTQFTALKVHGCWRGPKKPAWSQFLEGSTAPGVCRGDRGAVKTVIFACVHNAGRSQMAAAYFNKLAHPAKARALSAGTAPGDRVYPEVVTVMQEE